MMFQTILAVILSLPLRSSLAWLSIVMPVQGMGDFVKSESLNNSKLSDRTAFVSRVQGVFGS